MKAVPSNTNDRPNSAERELEHVLRTFFTIQTPKTWLAPHVITQGYRTRPMTRSLWQGHWALAASLGLLLGGYAVVNYVSRTATPVNSGKSATTIDIASPANKKNRPTNRIQGPEFLKETRPASAP